MGEKSLFFGPNDNAGSQRQADPGTHGMVYSSDDATAEEEGGGDGSTGEGLISVEELSLQHYASRDGGGWRGMHDEGGCGRTLFGLSLWDVLFADGVPAVFQVRTHASHVYCSYIPDSVG